MIDSYSSLLLNPTEIIKIEEEYHSDSSDEIVNESKQSWSNQCQFCDRHYRYQFNFLQHVDNCPKKFLQMNKSAGNKSYICNICNKQCLHITALNNHLEIHTAKKDYKHMESGKQFNQSTKLNEEMKMCTGERSYKCDECGKQFNRKGNLKKHKITHTGEKPYKCDDCGKQFNRKGDLNKHKLMHTG